MSVPVDQTRPLRPATLSYGPLELQTRYLLSPLAGFTNLPFRRMIRRVGGVGLCTTDLVNSRSLLMRRHKALELVQTSPDDRPLSIQIFGSEPSFVADSARLLEQEFQLESIDINMGCPVAKVAGHGAGAGLMQQSDEAVRLVEAVVQAVALPVTVKMRLGWDSRSLSAPWFARAFEQVGVAAIAIHGRTREQGFSGEVDLDGIRQVVEAVSGIPVIGNGDIRTVDDAARMLTVTGCDGISIGRGALANPWIFRQLVQWELTGQYDPPGSFDDRMTLLLEQFDYLVEQKGEQRALVSYRKTLHWYLKSMRVRPALRHEFQSIETRRDFDDAIMRVRNEASASRRTGRFDVPVPSGPNAHW